MDSIWVIVDKLTKSTHFILVNVRYSLEKLTSLYISEIVILHGVPSSIVLDTNLRFTSKFWDNLHQALGTKLSLSLAYHPQTNGQIGRTINPWRISLRLACWNNKVHGTFCCPLWNLPITTFTIRVLGWHLVNPFMVEGVGLYYSRQKSYHAKRRKDPEFIERDHMFLKVTSWTRVGRALKSLRKVTYQVALPPILANLHNVIHVLPVRIKEHRIKQLRGKKIPLVKVVWKGASSNDATLKLES
ncbi:hypothetical protein CR513_24224, partial [Mucuna pruriens]